MDQTLIAWALAVKARRGRVAWKARRPVLPLLWVFSDPARLPDPVPALRRIPKGLGGLVLRQSALLDADILLEAIAVCRARRFAVVLETPGYGPSGPGGRGRHFPGRNMRRRVSLATASAHDMAELVRARRGGVDCVFLSPAFATMSHPGAPALGALRWSALARQSRLPVLALGGITGASVRRLSARSCAGVGVIGAAAGGAAPPLRRGEAVEWPKDELGGSAPGG